MIFLDDFHIVTKQITGYILVTHLRVRYVYVQRSMILICYSDQRVIIGATVLVAFKFAFT